MAFRKFLRLNLEASEVKGSGAQQDEMAGVVGHTQQVMGELSDQLSGARKLKEHTHHCPKTLTRQVIEGIQTITEIRREIEKK